MSKDKIPLSSSLAFRTTVSVFVLTLGVLSAGGYFITSRIYDLNFENLRREAESAARFASKTLARPVWDMNQQGVSEILKSLSQNAVFCGAQVMDGDGKMFVDAGYPLTLSRDQSPVLEPIMFVDPAENANKIIGTLQVCVTAAPIRAQVWSIIDRLVISFALIAAGVLVALLASLRIILNPLRRFQDAITAFQRTLTPITDPELTRKNEVGYLVKSFNRMGTSLGDTYRALKSAKDEAEESYRVKTDFFSNMSHELRTPLNSVIGMTQLLKTRPMDDEQREMFTSVHRSAESLLKIVNDILDVAKIEARQIQLEYLPFDAYREIRDTVQSLQPQAIAKGLNLGFQLQGDDLNVYGDPSRFGRILLNLVSNAVRYTEHGSVIVSSKAEPADDGRVVLTVSVRDTGIGIPADKIDTIFEKFTQADSSTTRKYGGTGLGLTITRDLVEIMGGNIGVESDVGHGSIFTFSIPLDTTPKETQTVKKDQFSDVRPRHQPSIQPQDARILVAEDHPSNQLFMRKLLENLGVKHFIIAENGREALRALEAETYDLVLMDCHMPELNGYDTTLAIRDLDDPIRRNVPIVAMTANAMPEDEALCLSCGMDAYISKPVDIEIFKRKLSPWIAFPAEAGRPLAPKADLPVDLTNLRSNAAGDAAFEREMITLFVRQSQEQMERLESLCASGSNEDWVEAAHALKGTAGSVGANDMREACAHAQALPGVNPDVRRAIAVQIRHEYMKVYAYLVVQGLYRSDAL
jgi:signal transduction histidine kinase/CheY-like chemotaxis protein/HPt (histidine-containing phosphotransfer) domain-containing protein